MKGYRVGDVHPTRKEQYEEARPEEPSIPDGTDPGVPQGVVRTSGRGGPGLRGGTISNS